MDSPVSTAFRASSAAPIMTCGLDVLVHEVIDGDHHRAVVELEGGAVGTVTGVGLCARAPSALLLEDGGSEAGKLSSLSSSTPSSPT